MAKSSSRSLAAKLLNSEPFQYDPDPKNPLAFHIWDPSRIVAGKSLGEWVVFAVAWWHTIAAGLADVFGGPTREAPFGGPPKNLAEAYRRIDLMFKIMTKLGIKRYCFHDLDVIPTPKNLQQYEYFVKAVVTRLKAKQEEYGVRLLWGTAALFTMPHFASGAATSPNVDVFEVAAFQVQTMMWATKELGGTGYVLWGGREGYTTLWNTMLTQEEKQLAEFLRMVAKHKRKYYKGITLLIEPKFSEPCIVQYDSSAQVVLGFLARHGLLDDFELNLEVNHAELAHRTFWHEMEVARGAGKLNYIDYNMGDLFTGWDTDRFPIWDPRLSVEMSMSIIQNGGLTGVNFDAKARRESFDLESLLIGHAGGMDNMALGLQTAALIVEDGKWDEIVHARYRTWGSAKGRKILAGKDSLDAAAGRARRRNAFPKPQRGQQEQIESMVTAYLAQAMQELKA